jgi:arabinan endo-1,5-alpha-L-arabinosidase
MGARVFLLGLYCLLFSDARSQDLPINIKVHDPAIIKQDSVYYIFATGRRIARWSSVDLITWKQEKRVFEQPPSWAVNDIPGFKDHVWAPDISFYKDKYYLFYAVSVFGKDTSAIGLATNTTLNANDTAYRWVDHGNIIQSIPGKTNWNAIDPNLVVDTDGTPYLSFGSFWGGIKLVKLTKDRLKVDGSLATLPTLAIRKNKGANPIEAPFIYKKGNFFYLFASIDYCCKGAESTYKVIVGRAENVHGPFLDQDGKKLTEGGGTIVLSGDENWHGVGHCAVAKLNADDYMVFHGYDAADKGISKLLIRKIAWQDAWPRVTL